MRSPPAPPGAFPAPGPSRGRGRLAPGGRRLWSRRLGSRRLGSRRRDAGIALVAVLWVLVLLALVAASFTVTTRSEGRIVRNAVENARARALAEAGVNRAVLGLLERRTDAGWRADGSEYAFTLAGGEVTVSIRDEMGKIDLNRAPDELLRGLLVVAGVADQAAGALVDAIVDFRDGNDLRRLNGAEDDDYRRAGLPYGAKDRPFDSVAELQQVLGMTPELYRRLAPSLTVHSARARIDPAVAPADVLAAVPGMEAVEVERRLAAREAAAPGVPRAAVPTASALGRRYFAPSRNIAYTVRSLARMESGAVFVREAVIRLAPGKEAPYRILAWRRGELPAARAEDAAGGN